ncbi:hypothetical protein [Luteimonas sp. R10]|uniref:hypothetical protein n=1 Tax=Luteimonas sp. R10 TaxID=3108176 RepID=UPI00308DE9B2|nr:hypothetical protein U3649_18395 [Luteimonas sp. R10]
MPVSCRSLLLSLLAVALAGVTTASAQGLAQGQERERERERGRPEQGPSRAIAQPEPSSRLRRQDAMADSIRHIRSSTRGTLISAERMHSNGREINRIKVLDDRGRVRVYEDDPQQRHQRSRRDND